MSKAAFIFPGQGGQFVGQGKTWAETDSEVNDFFTWADEICGRPISKICFEGPAEVLNQTLNLQPAVATVSLAALLLMRKKGLKPDFTAGHSLGELSALCAAGVLDEETVLRLVAKRSALMEECTRKTPGSMSAVIGLSNEDLEGICELARSQGVVVTANFNTPEQTVISGESAAVAAAVRFVKSKGGKALPLPVTGAFHSPLMAEAGQKFAALLDEVTFKTPRCPVVQNVTGCGVSDPGELKNNLKQQITSSVRWVETARFMAENGAGVYIEAWPKLYSGSLIKKSLPQPCEKLISAADL